MTPITTVLFDLHTTLIHGGDAEAWWAAALDRHTGSSPSSAATAIAYLDQIWENVDRRDPEVARDFDPETHHRVFIDSVTTDVGLDPELAEHLYDTMLDQWTPYDDTLGVLHEIRELGTTTVLISNVGCDVSGFLERVGLSQVLDGVVVSHQVGAVKPDPQIFLTALSTVGAVPDHTLMVGDSVRADGGAALLGMRTLILPRTQGSVKGLGMIPAMIAASRGSSV